MTVFYCTRSLLILLMWKELCLSSSIAQISAKLQSLSAQHRELLSLWEKRQTEYEHYLDVHQFRRDAEMADGWLLAQEGFLGGEEWGESLDDVEELLKQQDDFEKTLAAQDERFQALLRETRVSRWTDYAKCWWNALQMLVQHAMTSG